MATARGAVVSTAASASGFPQTGNNRTMNEIVRDILEHVGGSNRTEAQSRATHAVESAIREYNNTAWQFNRMTNDITLVASTQTYTLASDFRSPVAAVMLNSSSQQVVPVRWIPYREWLHYLTNQQGSGSVPQFYTALNIHEGGLVYIDPIPGAAISYPTMRITYHRRILLPNNTGSVINVPQEIEEGIYQLAVANMYMRVGERGLWRDQRILAFDLRVELEADTIVGRDWPDIEVRV